jgi:predicted enzyme related to lactoylglutathione lyase
VASASAEAQRLHRATKDFDDTLERLRASGAEVVQEPTE